MIALLLLALMHAAVAYVPQCAVLFCGDGEQCRERFSEVWLQAAQEEAARVYNTINGGYLAAECTPNHESCRVPPLDDDVLHKVLCIDKHHVLVEETCALKNCSYASHPELFEDDDCIFGKKQHDKGDKDVAACRKIESWLQIANAKLVDALTANATSVPSATSSACAAELIFRMIAQHLETQFDADELPFLNEFSRQKHAYRHNNSLAFSEAGTSTLAEPEVLAVFDGVAQDGSPLVVSTVFVQSYRTCWRHETRRQTLRMSDGSSEMLFVKEKTKRERLASILVYSNYNGTNAEQQTQLLWAVGGTLAPFADTYEGAGDDLEEAESKKKVQKEDESSSSDTASVFTAFSDDQSSFSSSVSEERNDIDDWFTEFEQRRNNEKRPREDDDGDARNLCVLSGAESNLDAYDEARRLPFLELGDYAVVRGDGRTRRYRDLARVSSCGTVVLLRNLRTDAPQSSFTQLQLATFGTDESAALSNTTVLADVAEESLFVRVANDDGMCFDTEATLVFDADVVAPPSNSSVSSVRAIIRAASGRGAPLTMAPGESRCVGGSRANAACSAPSECGAGLACRRRPFDDTDDAAYCFDGAQWLLDQPCAFADADDECPFGECTGAANGLDGGQFPLLHFARSCHSVSGGADARVCADARVQQWHQFVASI